MNVENEFGEQQAVNEEVKSASYHVEVNKDFFNEIADKLTPVYNKELAEIKEDGSFQKLKDFHYSDRALFMAQIRHIRSQDPEKIPDIVGLNLSEEALDYINENLTPSSEFGDFKIYAENKSKLNKDFKDAKSKAERNAFAGKAKMDARIRNAKDKLKNLFKR